MNKPVLEPNRPVCSVSPKKKIGDQHRGLRAFAWARLLPGPLLAEYRKSRRRNQTPQGQLLKSAELPFNFNERRSTREETHPRTPLRSAAERREQRGGFDNKARERLQQSEQQLNSERQSKGGWQFIAGIFSVGAVVLFTVGTALGAVPALWCPQSSFSRSGSSYSREWRSRRSPGN